MGSQKVYEKTGLLIKNAIKVAKEKGIQDIVVASCSGKTARYLIGSGLNNICITHQIGFKGDNIDEMDIETRKELEGKGIKILTATHLLGGVGRALRYQFKGIHPSEIVSTTLRMLGQGLKVCVEISVMAADAGLIKAGKDIMSIGGTGIGADTSAIINPQHSHNFFKTKIKKIVEMPFDW